MRAHALQSMCVCMYKCALCSRSSSSIVVAALCLYIYTAVHVTARCKWEHLKPLGHTMVIPIRKRCQISPALLVTRVPTVL